MSRPYHSPDGFRRYIQMSSTRVFVFVEGRDTDSFFYSELARPICLAAGIPYEIVRGDRVGESGGKQDLIHLFRSLQSAGSLIDQSKGTTSWCTFYMDKDVDDIFRRLITSPHIVYTPFYSVENALFLYGNLIRAAAAVSSLDVATIGSRIANGEAWCRQKAEQLGSFVAISLFSHKHEVTCPCHYGRNSLPVNDPADSTANDHAVAVIKAELQLRSGMLPSEFERKFGASLRFVERCYRKGFHDSIFKGKWYRELLMQEIELAAGNQTYNRHALANAISATLRATLDFNGAWAEHFRTPLRRLIGA